MLRSAWLEAELRRRRGLILLDVGGLDAEAEASLSAALEAARRRAAKSWELRASMSLPASGPRRVSAPGPTTCAPVYGWFTEGFHTPDLKDAKALLDELR
jgi:predicted ATPase